MDWYSSVVRTVVYSIYGPDPLRHGPLNRRRLMEQVNRRMNRTVYDTYSVMVRHPSRVSWRELTRTYWREAHRGSRIDFDTIRSLQIATRLRLLMRRFVRGLWHNSRHARATRLERRADNMLLFHSVYDHYDGMLDDAHHAGWSTTWRDLTRHHLLGHVEFLGSLDNIDYDAMLRMSTATRIRLLMQRFVRGLKIFVRRARRMRRARRELRAMRRRIRASTRFDLNDSD